MSVDVFYLKVPEGVSESGLAAATGKLFEACGGPERIAPEDLVAIKGHVGELHSVTHVPPGVYRVLGEKVKQRGGQPFFTETSTLYKGERNNAVKHFIHAQRHGFTFEAMGLPFISADGLTGTNEAEVAIPGELSASVKIAADILMADALVSVAHVTGHLGSGFGATLKTIGMGLASRMGKLRQHSAMHPKISAGCTFCGKCLQWCPEEAIIEQRGKAFIVNEKCVGCGECVAVCRFDAVQYDWGMESAQLEKHIAEHALGAVQHLRGKCMFINAAVNITKDCDCMGIRQTKLIPDLGLLASADPVAVDQASLDLIRQAHGKDLADLAYPGLDGNVQLIHGEKIGLGSRQYRLVTVD